LAENFIKLIDKKEKKLTKTDIFGFRATAKAKNTATMTLEFFGQKTSF